MSQIDALDRAILASRLPIALRVPFAQRRIVAADPKRASGFVKAFAERPDIDGLSLETGLVRALVVSGKSLIRFGDGEALAMLGKNIWFQRPNERLRQGLFDAFFGHTKASPYLIALPHFIFRSKDELREGREGKDWHIWSKLRGLETIARTLRADRAAFDIFPLRDGLEDPSPLWESADSVVLVANEFARDRVLAKDSFKGRTVHHVPVPEQQVMDVFDSVCARIEAIFLEHRLRDDTPILISAGPAAKLIVLRFAGRNRVFDIGAAFSHHRPGLKVSQLGG